MLNVNLLSVARRNLAFVPPFIEQGACFLPTIVFGRSWQSMLPTGTNSWRVR